MKLGACSHHVSAASEELLTHKIDGKIHYASCRHLHAITVFTKEETESDATYLSRTVYDTFRISFLIVESFAFSLIQTYHGSMEFRKHLKLLGKRATQAV